MKNKSRSSTELNSTELNRSKVKTLHPLISPPNFDESSHFKQDSRSILSHHSNVSLHAKEFFRVREQKSKVSLTLKKPEEIKPQEEYKAKESIIPELDTLEKCRKCFEKIIVKDKKYGPVLKQIKDMYEKHINDQLMGSDINLKAKIIKKSDGSDKLTKRALIKARSNVSLIENKSMKISLLLQKKNSLSNLDTIISSPRVNIPELSLNAVPRADFHQEFVANYENFSESWRKLVNDLSN